MKIHFDLPRGYTVESDDPTAHATHDFTVASIARHNGQLIEHIGTPLSTAEYIVEFTTRDDARDTLIELGIADQLDDDDLDTFIA